MQVKVEKLPKATIKINIIVPADKVLETYNHVLEEFAAKAEITGFRKGKAPLDLVEKSINESELNGEVVNHLLQTYYVGALKEHQITSIGNPKVTIKSFDKNKEFEFDAELAVRPEIKLKDYKQKIKELKEKKAKAEPKEELTVDDVIQAISEGAVAEFSDLLIEDEVTRMLSRLLQQAETLGLSIDQYLGAQNKTAESLKKEYEEAARKTITAEFALSKAIEEEGIKVGEAEIDEAIQAVPDETLRQRLQNGQDRWYILSVLAKNKLIAKLATDGDEEQKDSKKEDK